MPQRPDTRAELFLLPPSLDELVDAGHPVRYVAAFVEALTADDWGPAWHRPDGEHAWSVSV